MNDKVENLKGKLIVSCQALPHEPLHSSFIMGRMALAAKEGGAAGIRANTKEDIAEIQAQVDLPIIGIVKRDYEDSKVYITPTGREDAGWVLQGNQGRISGTASYGGLFHGGGSASRR